MIAILLIACLFAAPGRQAFAQSTVNRSAPVILQADELIHDRNDGTVIATGNVEAAQGNRVLLADRITYNEKTDTVIATGNVTLLEPSGDVIFADYIELKDEMKNGFIRNLRMIMSDQSRFAANGAVRSGGNRTEMSKAVYSPCPLCVEHPRKSPLWQIKSARVVHDERRQQITYTDAFFELFGVPIAYTPYFSHPDPTVKRRSGFLTPSFGSSSRLGSAIKIPYFFNLAPNRDATLAPIFTTDEGIVLTGEYRHRVESGQFTLNGSITRPETRGDNGETLSGRDTRGHIEGVGAFKLDDTWKWGFDVARATDDTYLRRYSINSEDTLTSNLFIEGFRGRNYTAVNAYSFQGLKVDDDPGDTPIIAPIMDYSFISDAGRQGQRFTFDANFMELFRTDGTGSTRLSLDGGWRRPFLGPIGDLYTVSASLRGDAYWVNDVLDPARTDRSKTSGFTGRVVPQVAIDWRLPMIRDAGTVRQIIEPIVKFTVSPHGGNPRDIPNEDSQSFEFDDTNLFNDNRFSGRDRIEGGPRLSYGIRAGAYGASGGSTTAFIGQSFRSKADSTFAPGSGLENKLSDFVGRISIRPSSLVDLTYRFRLDSETLASRRTTIDLSAGPAWLRGTLGFLSIDDGSADLSTIGRREELNLSLRMELGPEWSFDAFHRRDLGENQSINMGAGLTYQNECILFATEIRRDFTRDRDLEPSTSINFIIKFRNLG